jgi:hypothetical protein
VNVELLELAAAALSDLVAEVVFLGGAIVELWITDPGAPPVRQTQNVDVSAGEGMDRGPREFRSASAERRLGRQPVNVASDSPTSTM